MISSLTLKKIATYDENVGVTINDLKKVNFFFGFNGSGKSTIAKYLHNLSLDDNERSQDFNNCSQIGYNKLNHHILTFDENFTEVNFKRNPVLKGVFSLNQQNEIIDRQITSEDNLIKEYEKIIKEKEVLKVSIEKDKKLKQTSLIEHCWSQRSAYGPFTKISLVYSGSKSHHLQEIRNKLQNPLGTVFDIAQLTNTYNLLYGNEIIEVTQTINTNRYKEIRKIEVKLEQLLQEVIVGNEDVDIAGLINTLNARTWVETGTQFIDKTDGVCPFCQKQTIDEELKEQFNKYFDKSYKEKIDKIKNLNTEYELKTTEFLNDIIQIQNVFNPDNSIAQIYISLQTLFNTNKTTISEKLLTSNERKSIPSLNTIKNELSQIVLKIKTNNGIYSALDENKNQLIVDIWNSMASNCKNEIEKFDKRIIKYNSIEELADHIIQSYSGKIATSKQTIETLRSQTVNTKEAVDNINTILRNTGFEGFEIAEKDLVNNIPQYFLKRHNNTDETQIFKTLSEGEKNFISFLYFYQLCIGTDDIQSNGNKKKILVIDDPVSSLDSQALFVVSTLIHDLISQKGKIPSSDLKLFKNTTLSQVFLLTHNLYFYKEVAFNKRPICTDYWHYKITKTRNKSEINGQYSKIIHDDYSLLWKTIKELKGNIPQNTALNIVISNTMRRIIESYVNFIGYGNSSWDALFNLNQQEPTYYIKCAFISMINEESHKITALDGVYYQKIINEQPQILFDVFKEIFKTIGKDHYEMMLDEQIN